MLTTFEMDWESTGFDEARAGVEGSHLVPPEVAANARLAILEGMPPLKSTLKKAIRQAAKWVSKEALANGDLKATVKAAVKRAVKDAVKEIVNEDS